MASTQSAVRALLDSRSEACRAKDIDRLMSLYSPSIAYFDCVPPLQGFLGADAVRRNFLRWFDEYEGPIGLETRDLNIVISEGVAFAHMLHLDKGNVHFSKADEPSSPAGACHPDGRGNGHDDGSEKHRSNRRRRQVRRLSNLAAREGADGHDQCGCCLEERLRRREEQPMCTRDQQAPPDSIGATRLSSVTWKS